MRRTPRWATQAACSPRSLRPYATWRSCARKYTRTRYRGRIPPIKTLCGHEDPPLGLQLDPWCDVFPFRSFSLSLSLSVFLSLCSLCPCFCVSHCLFHSLVYVSVSLSLCLNLPLRLSLWLLLCLCLSVGLCVCVCLSICLCLCVRLSPSCRANIKQLKR